jgi:hypothetical protein
MLGKRLDGGQGGGVGGEVMGGRRDLVRVVLTARGRGLRRPGGQVGVRGVGGGAGVREAEGSQSGGPAVGGQGERPRRGLRLPRRESVKVRGPRPLVRCTAVSPRARGVRGGRRACRDRRGDVDRIKGGRTVVAGIRRRPRRWGGGRGLKGHPRGAAIHGWAAGERGRVTRGVQAWIHAGGGRRGQERGRSRARAEPARAPGL